MSDSPGFYVDASVPIAVAEALSLVRSDIMYPGKPGCPIDSPATKDSVWLPVVGAQEWIVIMRDKKIRHRPGEKAALLAAGVGAFLLTAGGNLNRWDTLKLIVQKWAVMEEITATTPRPFLFAVTSGAPRQIV